MIGLIDEVAEILERKHTGHLIAYAASHLSGEIWCLSIVRDGEEGHYPLPHQLFCGTIRQAFGEAARLNRERLRLPTTYVASIVARSMRGHGTRRSTDKDDWWL